MAKLHIFCIVFLSSFFLGCLVCPCIYAADFITHHCSSDHPNTNCDSSSFQTALKDALSDLVGASSSLKSHHSTVEGVGVGVIHASFHCWRNIPSQACMKCVESATKSILRLCPGHQNATVWNLDCTLHYVTSHKLEHGGQENNIIPWAWWYSLSSIDEVVTNQDEFESSLTSFMSTLIEKATADSRRFVATREVIITLLDTLYGMVECSTSETPETCKDCLWAAVERATGCCGGSRAVEVILPSCRLGYDLGPSMSRASLVGPFSSATSFSDNVIVSKSIANVKKK